MARETYIPQLLQLFRQHGYDGATLSKISEATGLGKASLYHYFPGGKEEMAHAVLDTLERWFDAQTSVPLRQAGSLKERLRAMGQKLYEAYEGGSQPCLYAILMTASTRDAFSDRVAQLMMSLIAAIAKAFEDEGYTPEASRRKGEDAAILIQGALILSQVLKDNHVFARTITELPQRLLTELGSDGQDDLMG